MARHFPDWLRAYVDYASYTEAPLHFHYWSGVSAIASALRRGVWVDMLYFKWFPSMYVILVAPPGVANKTTTIGIAREILERIPGINFGSSAVTGPKLIDDLAGVSEMFDISGMGHPQSALTMHIGELGNFLNPDDREFIDWLVEFWDAKTGVVSKGTRGMGTVSFENPFLNIIACTTPTWLQGYMPEHMIGGGFTSRCIFAYAEEKRQYIAYPQRKVPKGQEEKKQLLVADLQHIATQVRGPYTLTERAYEWGEAWYEDHWKNPPTALKDKRFKGYLSRMQAHVHKLAMVIAASRRDKLVITEEDLKEAFIQVSLLESDLPKVFAGIGQTQDAMQANRLVDFIRAHPAGVDYKVAYQFVHTYFPSASAFEDILSGAVRAGLIRMAGVPGGMMLYPVKGIGGQKPEATAAPKQEVTCSSDSSKQTLDSLSGFLTEQLWE